MKKLISYLRVEEWLTSKVTLMVGILLFFSYVNSTCVGDVVKNTIAYFLSVSMFLAISYVANDFSDIDVDIKAGKKKVIAEMPKCIVWISFFLMFLIGNIPIIMLAKNKIICSIIILITYVLGLSYSTLGLRFKERGIWGLIECSFAQRCMPLFLIICIEPIKDFSVFYLIGWIIISFIDGLRYILIHQVLDMDNDIKSGVNTFVTQKRNNFKNVIVAFFILEIFIIMAVMIPMWIDMPILLACICVVYALFEFCIYMVLNVYAKKNWFVTFDSVPLETFFNVLFPITIGIFMAKTLGWMMIIYCILVIIICFRSFKIKLDIAAIFIKSKMGKLR